MANYQPNLNQVSTTINKLTTRQFFPSLSSKSGDVMSITSVFRRVSDLCSNLRQLTSFVEYTTPFKSPNPPKKTQIISSSSLYDKNIAGYAGDEHEMPARDAFYCLVQITIRTSYLQRKLGKPFYQLQPVYPRLCPDFGTLQL